MISVSLPIEVIQEILLRLPAKSIARYQCVSKLWASMLRRPCFTELFLTRSSAQPRLFFAIEKDGLWSIFSLPQHQSPYEKSSSSSQVVTAEFHMNFPPGNMRIYDRDDRRFSCGYANGLMYFYGMWVKEEDWSGFPVILNPKTGRYTTLPFLQRYRKTYSFLGFDPIEKQYKVLHMSYPACSNHHKILTIGTGDMRWRQKRCSLYHVNVSEGICVNGVLYYLGDTSEEMKGFVIVCFDVRSEKFKFIYPESYCELINYKGKLGVIYYDDYADYTIKLRLCVLEDVEKLEWSEYAYTFRDEKFKDHYASVVGVNASGEIVLSMGDFTSNQEFYVFYFNPEKNTLTRVEIQGFGEYHEALSSPSRVHVFLDDSSSIYTFAERVEDVKVNDPKLLNSKFYDIPDYNFYMSESDEEDEEESYNKKKMKNHHQIISEFRKNIRRRRRIIQEELKNQLNQMKKNHTRRRRRIR